jgi:cell division protein FtsW
MKRAFRQILLKVRAIRVDASRAAAEAGDGLARLRSRASRVSSRAADLLGITPRGALLSTVILLVTIGTVMVFSASFFYSSVNGDPYSYLRKQFLWLPIAVLSGILAMRFDYRDLKRWYWPILLGTVGLLAVVLVPGLGHKVNNARRWIQLGSMQFQPSELAKLTAVIFISGLLAMDPSRIRLFWKGFVPACGGVFLIVGLILVEPDFGTSMFVFLLAASLLLIAGIRKRFAILSFLLAAPPIALFIRWRWEFIKHRLLAFIDPDQIYQVKQSLIALGAGGLWGAGLGRGSQKLKFLPEPQTDFIFAVIAEETGLIGSLVVILLFVALLYAGAAIARRSRDYFGFLLASGIVIALGLQAAINLAVVTASGPTKGIPLPFITFGGSGLVMTLIQVGLLLSVDRIAREGAEKNIHHGGTEVKGLRPEAVGLRTTDGSAVLQPPACSLQPIVNAEAKA